MIETAQDSAVIQALDAEAYRLYYKPRTWLVHNSSVQTNIYGEPGDAVIGSDGVTSVPATRTFTSASKNFTTLGVSINDILEIYTEGSLDKGRYDIDAISSDHVLHIASNWPVGSLIALKFRVLMMGDRYSPFFQAIPFNIKLTPTEDDLKRFGIEQKGKPIDAIISMSILLCDRMGITPKIGDRFNYTYLGVDRQYEVLTLVKRDQIADSGIPLHYVGSASKTRDLY